MKTRLEVCSSLLLRNKNDPFLKRIFTCDEKWILHDNRRRSAQWLDKDEPPRSMPKPNLHLKKITVTIWWSAAGLIHCSFLRPGATIIVESCNNELEVVHQKQQTQQSVLVNIRGPILLHDNATTTRRKNDLAKIVPAVNRNLTRFTTFPRSIASKLSLLPLPGQLPQRETLSRIEGS